MSDYINARLSLTRQHDGRRFGGWVRWATDIRAEVIIPTMVDLAIGDVLIGEINGLNRKGQFISRVNAITDEIIYLDFQGAMKESSTDQDARLRVDRIQGGLVYHGKTVVFVATDMSPRGIGVEVAEPIEPGTSLQFAISLPNEILLFTAEVRHCRMVEPGRYKVGMLMADFGRIEQARWRKCMMTCLASNETKLSAAA